MSKSNMQIEHTNNGLVCRSYGKIIAINNLDGITLDSYYYNYSVTTAKHLNKFLGLNSKSFNQALKANKFKFTNLN